MKQWYKNKREHLLIPAVGNREHPLLVDKYPTTEVVAVVKGGHVWTRVRLALLSTNDPSILTGNCHCLTQTHTDTNTQRVICVVIAYV